MQGRQYADLKSEHDPALLILDISISVHVGFTRLGYIDFMTVGLGLVSARVGCP